MDPNKPRLPSHLRALDGLRGFACLAVVAHHCYYSAGQYNWPFGLPKLFSYGFWAWKYSSCCRAFACRIRC
jgi:peptidoglycan/LPS O-acetylase OafA/YrhL